jgi:prevent-host-death family protein
MQVNVNEAKANLSRLIRKAMDGHEVVIAKAGQPMVKLVPIPKSSGKKVLGSAKDVAGLALKEGWDAALTDIEMVEWFGL